MHKDKKVQVVQDLKQLFDGASATVLTSYEGLKANEMADLRRQFHDAEVKYRVIKNTLAKRALTGQPLEALGEKLVNTIAVAIASDDQTAPAKVIFKFFKDNPKINERLSIVCGTLDEDVIDADQVASLSKMPGKLELRAQLLGLFNNVPGGFVRLLNAVPGGMVNVLDARRREMEESA